MEFLDNHSNILRPTELAIITACILVNVFCAYGFLTDMTNEWMLMSITLNLLASINVLIITAAIALDKRKTIHNDFQMLLFTMAAGALMFDSLTGYLEGVGNLATWNYFSYVMKNLLYLFVTGLYMKFLFTSIGVSAEKARKYYWIANAIILFALVLVATNFFTEMLFDVDDTGHIARGTYRPLFILCPMAIGSMALLSTFKYDEDQREKIVAVILLISTWAVFLLDYHVTDLSPIYLIPAMVLMISFSNNYIYRSEVLSKKEILIAKKNSELADLKFNAMVTQMQPHFLYNALTSIVNIKGNPPETREAIIDFASYLRTNLNTINNPHPIPFSKELDHIETYLSLEKLRFKDKLEIVWHINDRRFVIPALTAQTMVENAVRHGVSKRENGGRVIIVSEAVEDGHMIKVIDNGVGYDPNGPAPNDGRSHIGITSARERLKTMCNGTLTVKSAPGKGTTVTIFIPDAGFTNREEDLPEPESEVTEKDPDTENE